MTSILRLNSFQEFQLHHPLFKIREIIDSFLESIKIEIGTASNSNKKDLEEFQSELKTMSSSKSTDIESLNYFINDFSLRLRNKGFDCVITNTYKEKISEAKFTDKLELVFKRVDSNIPTQFKASLEFSDFDFHEKHKTVDSEYCNYQSQLAFREMHSIFSNMELDYKQRFAFILGSFLTHVPENSLHIFNYLQSVGKITQTYLAHCQINECDNNSIDNVCEGISLALGYAIGFSIQTSLKQSANVQIVILEDQDEKNDTNFAIELVDSLHAVPDYLLCRDSALSIHNDENTEGIIKWFFGIDCDSILTLPNAVGIARVLDWLVPQTVGYDFYPLDYDDIQIGLSKDINTSLIKASAMHTLISLLKQQFPVNLNY